MIITQGDLWEWHELGRWVVVATNIGWKKNGANPMGVGTALRAAMGCPELPRWYGARCRKYGAKTAVAVYEPYRIFLFPTKPLNEEQPWLSWQSDSSLELIERSACQLQLLVDVLTERKKIHFNVGVPLVGCQHGRLRPDSVVPILEKHLDDRFKLLLSNRKTT